MLSIRQFVFCFSLFNLNGFILAEIFHQDDSSLLTSIPEITSSLVTIKTREAIEATKFIPFKPLTFFTALKETAVLNLTEQSLNTKIINSISVATATGGILGCNIYNLYSYNFYWRLGNCSETRKLVNRVSYFNAKYGSYPKALDFPDGIISINIEIATNGDLPNPKFDALFPIFSKNVKKPGDFVKINSAFTYTWFVNFPLDSVFHTYKKQFVDNEYGKKYIAQVIELPSIPCLNFISNEQFEGTFGKIKLVSEDSLNDFLLQDNSVALKESHKGVCIVNVPA